MQKFPLFMRYFGGSVKSREPGGKKPPIQAPHPSLSQGCPKTLLGHLAATRRHHGASEASRGPEAIALFGRPRDKKKSLPPGGNLLLIDVVEFHGPDDETTRQFG